MRSGNNSELTLDGIKRTRRMIVLPLFIAVAIALFGVQDYNLARRSSAQPEEITLRDLIKRGPEGNANIILTNFTIFNDYIYRKQLLTGEWKKVWVPIIPLDANEKESRKPAIHAFLYSENIKDEGELRARFDRPKLPGMVNPDGTKPGIIGSVLIQRSYPGTDPQQCLIIEEGKEPASIYKLVLYVFGFLVFAGLTIAIWFWCKKLEKDHRRVEVILLE